MQKECLRASRNEAEKPEAVALKAEAKSSANQGPADDLDETSMDLEIEKALTACQTVVQAEKEKIQATLKTALEKLHAELSELKDKLSSIADTKAT